MGEHPEVVDIITWTGENKKCLVKGTMGPD
jgi:hypothetical protein